jgi:hypothetical protein
MNIDEHKVNKFIKRFKTNNQEAYWDNYTLIIWRKDSSGFSNVRGLFRNNCWGLSEKISVGDNGMWELPHRYVKYIK